MQNPQAAGAQARAGGSEALRERMARDGPSCSLFSSAALQCPVTPLSGRGVAMSQGEGLWPERPSPWLLPSVPAFEQADTRGVSSERCLHRAADRSRRRAPRPRPPPPPPHSRPGCGLTLPALVSHLSPQYTAQGRFYAEVTPSYAPGSQCGLWLGRSSGSQALLLTSTRPSFNKIPSHWSPRYPARSFGLHRRRYNLPPASGSSLGVTRPLQLPSLSPRQWLPRPEVL